jgi:uncharacterized protein (TIGR03067 family)
MKFIMALGFAALGLCWSQVRADDEKKDSKSGPDRLVGEYVIVGGEKDGEKVSPDRLKEVKVRIARNAITTFDRQNKEVYVATYDLNTDREPWRITMTATLTPAPQGKGARSEGLIQMEGETVRLIYALPGGKAPSDFKAGEKQQMFVLKRAGK